RHEEHTACRGALAEARAERARGPLEGAGAGIDGERVHVVAREGAERERRGGPQGASRDHPARRIEAAAQAAVGEAGPPEQALLADAQGIEVEVADLRYVGLLWEAVDAAVLVDGDDQVAADGSVDVDDRRRAADVEVRDVDQTALVPPLPGAGDRIESDQRLRQLGHLRLLHAVSGRHEELGPVPAHGGRPPDDAAEGVVLADRIEGPELLSGE